MPKNDKRLISEILDNLCEVYSLLNCIELVEKASEANRILLTPTKIIVLEQNIENIQAKSVLENIQDLIQNYNNKIKTIDKIFKKIFNLRSLINEATNKIETIIKKKDLGGTATANELNFSKMSLEQLNKNLDNIEYSASNILNDIKSVENNINNFTSLPPNALLNTDPQLILSIKNVIQKNSLAITSIKKNLNDIETKILNIKTPIDKIKY